MEATVAFARLLLLIAISFGLLALGVVPASGTCGTWTAPTTGDAVTNSRSGDTYPTIQAAIDAATAGDTLTVTASTHTEGPVNVSKNITLSGSATVQAAADTCASGDGRGWFVVPSGVELTVRGLTFDGNGKQIYQAFRHQGSGTFTDCTFTDIKYQASGPAYQGTAIAIFGGHGQCVDVSHCTFTDIGRTGVLFSGTSIGEYSNCTVSNSTYTGKGHGHWLDYGIDVEAYSIVTLSGNTITDNKGVLPSGTSSAGIQVTSYRGEAEATVTQNTITDNAIGIAAGYKGQPIVGGWTVDNTNLTATHNTIHGNTIGLLAESNQGIKATDNNWGCSRGPGYLGCDTIEGTWAYFVDTGTTKPVTWTFSKFPPSDYPVNGDQSVLVVATFADGGGVTAEFSARNATLSAAQVDVVDGKAVTTLTTDSSAGGNVVAGVDISFNTQKLVGPSALLGNQASLKISHLEAQGSGNYTVQVANPNGTATLYGSNELGLSPKTPGCNVGLGPVSLGDATMLGSGTSTITFQVSENLRINEVYLQAYDSGCNVSNILTINSE